MPLYLNPSSEMNHRSGTCCYCFKKKVVFSSQAFLVVKQTLGSHNWCEVKHRGLHLWSSRWHDWFYLLRQLFFCFTYLLATSLMHVQSTLLDRIRIQFFFLQLRGLSVPLSSLISHKQREQSNTLFGSFVKLRLKTGHRFLFGDRSSSIYANTPVTQKQRCSLKREAAICVNTILALPQKIVPLAETIRIIVTYDSTSSDGQEFICN